MRNGHVLKNVRKKNHTCSVENLIRRFTKKVLKIKEDRFYEILDKYEENGCDIPEDKYYPSIDEIREHLGCNDRQETEDIVDYLVFFSFNPFKGIAGFDDDESYLETLRFIDYVLKHDIMLVA